MSTSRKNSSGDEGINNGISDGTVTTTAPEGQQDQIDQKPFDETSSQTFLQVKNSFCEEIC
jgi:hypothetical protein